MLYIIDIENYGTETEIFTLYDNIRGRYKDLTRLEIISIIQEGYSIANARIGYSRRRKVIIGTQGGFTNYKRDKALILGIRKTKQGDIFVYYEKDKPYGYINVSEISALKINESADKKVIDYYNTKFNNAKIVITDTGRCRLVSKNKAFIQRV